jgi:hypothetical protein
MLAIYVTAYAEGVWIKLAGRVEADPLTGRLKTTFASNPQMPFSRFQLSFFDGPRAALAMPQSCGTFTTTGSFTPWNGAPAVELSDSFTVDSECASGFSPSFSAGSENPRAGASSPFHVSFARGDRDEEFSGLKVTLPPGLLAKTAGVALCSDANAAAGSCPESSRVGSVTSGAGAGSTPIFLPGKAYLTGPYKGAPYGLSVVVPAVAGPYDLGMVVVRQALHVDPVDAHVTAVSDPLPTILKGIPLRLRRVDVALDRPGFMVNPTSCEEMAIAGALTSTKGTEAIRQARFQLGDCASLAFVPKLGLRATGKKQTRTGGHPGIRAVVTQAKGQAGIDKAVVRLPKALALDPDNAQALCEFEAGTKPDLENHCPKGSIVGRAQARTPLLDKPLAGNVYFVKNVRRNPRTGAQIRTLPMLIVALRGAIDINLKGTSSVKGGRLVNTFATVPDAPVSKFNLNLKGGSNGILTVTGSASGPLSLCQGAQTTNVKMNGHNGKTRTFATKLKTPCAKKKTNKKAKR